MGMQIFKPATTKMRIQNYPRPDTCGRDPRRTLSGPGQECGLSVCLYKESEGNDNKTGNLRLGGLFKTLLKSQRLVLMSPSFTLTNMLTKSSPSL